MKKSKDWVRKEDLDVKAGAYVRQHGRIPEGMTPNEFAEKLGVPANGNYYRWFREWIQRPQPGANQTVFALPSAAKTKLEDLLAETSRLVVEGYSDLVADLAGNINATANLRVQAAENRQAASDAEREDILQRLEDVEQELDAALGELATASRKADDLQKEIYRLEGRIAEREDRMRREAEPEPAIGPAATSTSSEQKSRADGGDGVLPAKQAPGMAGQSPEARAAGKPIFDADPRTPPPAPGAAVEREKQSALPLDTPAKVENGEAGNGKTD